MASGGAPRAGTALVTGAPLLLLDEPTVGADPQTRTALLAAVRARAAAFGAAVLYTTHYLPELAELGATLAVARAGRIIARGWQDSLTRGLPGELRLRRAEAGQQAPRACPRRWRGRATTRAGNGEVRITSVEPAAWPTVRRSPRAAWLCTCLTSGGPTWTTSTDPCPAGRCPMPRESAGRTAALIRVNTVLLLRDPGALISRMILPLAFLVLLHPLYLEAAQGRSGGIAQAVIATRGDLLAARAEHRRRRDPHGPDGAHLGARVSNT